MKTLLLWGVSCALSRLVAAQLAVAGHRLLVTGPDLDKLQELDLVLSQSELHRYADLTAPREVADWVREQHLGLDGVVWFPQEPGPTTTLLVPLSANLRHAEQAFYSPLELLRELVPQLRRGKRPKHTIVVLPWNVPASSASPQLTLLANSWQSALPMLASELGRDEVHINVVCVPPGAPETAIVPPKAPPNGEGEARSKPDEASSDEGNFAHQEMCVSSQAQAPAEHCASARFVSAWFSPALTHLTGQFITYPEHLGSRFTGRKRL